LQVLPRNSIAPAGRDAHASKASGRGGGCHALGVGGEEGGEGSGEVRVEENAEDEQGAMETEGGGGGGVGHGGLGGSSSLDDSTGVWSSSSGLRSGSAVVGWEGPLSCWAPMNADAARAFGSALERVLRG
jgi:hypothetical protein